VRDVNNRENFLIEKNFFIFSKKLKNRTFTMKLMTMILVYLATIICVPVTGIGAIQLSADNINSALGNN
jgi:hypothetical protein